MTRSIAWPVLHFGRIAVQLHISAHPPPEQPQYYQRPDLRCIPLVGVRPFRYGLVRLATAASAEVAAFIRCARDYVTDPYATGALREP